MSDLQLATTEDLIKELEGRFESIVIIGELPPLNSSVERSREEKETAQYRAVKGDVPNLNFMLDVIKMEILGTFLETGRDPEAWER